MQTNRNTTVTQRSRRAHPRTRLLTIAGLTMVAGLVAPTPLPELGGSLAAAPPAPVRQVSGTIDDAGRPSISGDGRWVVFSGTVGDRVSVFRTDRSNDSTVELSVVPDGVPPGDTVLPQISADGCVVVAISQVAFDLFRDNDRDPRFD